MAISYIFMRSPMLAASAAMDIDELSGGRMIWPGSGTKRMNEDWYSMSLTVRRRRDSKMQLV